MDTLLRALDEVRATGSGRLVLVSGEAGVGKSRLVGDLVQSARADGFVVLSGSCTPDATVPYAPFVQAVRRGTRHLDREHLAEVFDGSAMLAAALLPEVAAPIGLPAAAPRPEDLSAAVWHLLSRLFPPTGGVLLLEDVHWADADTLRLLTDLARELADLTVLVVATYRADELHRRHPLRQVLAELSRERLSTEVVLNPLSREDVRAMVSEIFNGTEVGDDFTDVVLDRTGGNPFFVEELAKVLVERGDVYHAGDDWERRDLADIEMPLTVRETLLARARTLTAAAQEVLQLAALASDRLDPEVLAVAVGVGSAAIDEVVRDGLNLQLLSEVRDGARTSYVFRHALTREAFADELVGPDRRQAHARLAEAVAAVHADDLDTYAAELADHFEAGQRHDDAVAYAVRAGRVAATAFASEEADRRFDQALRLMPPNDPARLDVLLEASGDPFTLDLSPMKLSFAAEARRLAATRGDVAAEARAILVIERDRWIGGDGAGAVAMAEEALRLVHGHDDRLEAWVLHRLGRLLALGDRVDEARVAVASGIEVAERAGNQVALSGLYGTLMMVVTYGPEFVEARDASRAAARAAGDWMAESNLGINAGYISLWCGDFVESRREFERGNELTRRIAPNDRYGEAGYAWLLALSGEYAAANELAGALQSDPRLPTRIVALTALCEVAERTADPRLVELSDELTAAGMRVGEAQRSVPSLSVRARETLGRAGTAEALPLFHDLVRFTGATDTHASHWPFSPDLARAQADDGDVDGLASWARTIGDLTARDPNPHNRAAEAMVRAYLSLARGETADAAAAFAAVTATYRAMPCPAREVEGLLGLAAAQTADGLLDEAERSARSALDVAESVGAAQLASRARAAVERAQAPPVLATVMITDIVGSTERAVAMGDVAWKELLARHHAIVRRELARARGREMDTAGDGFFAAFDLPAQGVRCAVSIRDALAAAGIDVRAGLHTGEARPADGKLTGLTVHIAARIAALAGRREVLVSGTLRDLAVGSGLVFEGRGDHVLRGVPGEWRLYAVTSP
jgi:class 3 adenylate cyclase